MLGLAIITDENLDISFPVHSHGNTVNRVLSAWRVGGLSLKALTHCVHHPETDFWILAVF